MKKNALFISLTFSAYFLHAQNIYTIAGGTLGNGDSVKTFGTSPNAVAIDASGNIYFADPYHYCVYEVTGGGVLSVVAGSNTYGYSGDGGPATDAKLNYPSALAIDAAGDIYITEYNNNIVRKVDKSGIISTVAGNGTKGYSGDGAAATAAQLYEPNGIALDGSGNIYVSDSYNNVIRKINTSGIISTIAGDGFGAGNGYGGYLGNGVAATTAEMNYPYGLYIDASGDIYVADQRNNCIREINTSGIINTVAGNGTQGFSGNGAAATAARLNNPASVVLDVSGNMYIADDYNSLVREVNTSGIINSFAGNNTAGGYSGDGGIATNAELNNPSSLAIDGVGNIYIADENNHRIREVNTSGNINTLIGNGTARFSGDGGPATAEEIDYPTGLTLDASGNLYIADFSNNRIRKINTSGIISTVAGNGKMGFTGDGGQATDAELNQPSNVAVDGLGNIYIVEDFNNRIRKVNTSGVITTIAGDTLIPGYSGDGGPATAAQLNAPNAVAIDASGNIFIADADNNCIRRIDTLGIITTVAGNGTRGYSGDGFAATVAELNTPMDVKLDASGNMYIADFDNARIRKVDTSGIITTVVGNGKFGFIGDGGPATAAELYPVSVFVDTYGNIYTSDLDNNRIRKVNKAGIINNIVGDTTLGGFGGDGGPAIAAKLNSPRQISVDVLGDIFIADAYNNRIREVTNGIPLVLNDIAKGVDLKVYPVPNNGKFNITVTDNYQLMANSQIEIYNTLCEKIYSAKINNNTIQIDLDYQSAGVYIYRIITQKGNLISSGKFLIQ